MFNRYWQCPNCVVNVHIGYDDCWTCHYPRPQSQHNELQQTGGLDDEDLIAELKDDEEIRIRVANKVFCLNTKMIQMSPLLSKMHNDDMIELVQMEQLLSEVVVSIFDLDIPKEIVLTICELTIAHIPTIQSNVILLSTFEKIVSYLEYHQDSEVSQLLFDLPLNYNDGMDEVTKNKFDLEFVNQLDSFEIVNFVFAANYLECIPLWQLLLVNVAMANKGKPFDFLVDRFGGHSADWIRRATPNEWWSS